MPKIKLIPGKISGPSKGGRPRKKANWRVTSKPGKHSLNIRKGSSVWNAINELSTDEKELYDPMHVTHIGDPKPEIWDALWEHMGVKNVSELKPKKKKKWSAKIKAQDAEKIKSKNTGSQSG